MRIVGVLLLTLFIVTACDSHAGLEPDGRTYKQDLVTMIKVSDRIVVTEHSSPDDLYIDYGIELAPEEFLYGQLELSKRQTRTFLSAIKQLDPGIQDWHLMCAPQYHHTIRFYAAGNLTSTMRICFECKIVEWDGTKAPPPESLYSGLAEFITGIGLHPEREWWKLAYDQYQKRPLQSRP